MKRLLLVLAIVTYGLSAQEAHIIALRSDDAAHARCTWERLQKAQKEWEQVQEDVRKDYILVPEGDKNASNTVLSIQGGAHTYRRGFEGGFQFSEDFKYIVPKSGNGSGSCTCWNGGSYGGSYYSCPCTQYWNLTYPTSGTVPN